MKNLKNISKIGLLAVGLVVSQSCVNDLDRTPFIEVTSATVYTDPANYKQILAKMYAGYAVSGQQGPDGKPDISGIDEGFSTYLRQYWKAQELTTDEAVIGWNDGNLRDYHDMDWTSSNEFVTAMYNRIYYQITLTNEFIRETTDAKLKDRGISAPEILTYRAEARFLRALSYFHALDMFGNVPFVTEADAVGSFTPKQTTRAELFAYIESELKAIDADLAAPKTNEYGRADKAAAWTLLAKLYLNAQVYTGTAKNNETLEYCNKIIGAGYTLDAKYATLFLADNDKSKEVIFPITFDGTRTKTWGGMTFLVHAPVGGSMNPAEFGINGGWGGIRTTKSFVQKYSDITGATDQRATFYTKDQNLDIDDIFKFADGYAITKYKNVTSSGAKGSDIEGNFPDTDFPMFRLADVYLMYAEAVLRGGTGGTTAEAVSYINKLRERAYGNTSGNITNIDLNFVLDERARELYWEGHRRTDLIRFGKFSGGTYLWPWKGAVKDGKAVPEYLNLFPIPSSDIVANPNLKQNTGY
ncbi:RagB/SusD family nutrient uptake outer membrane protein [Lacihabitans sp. LS3-19]|uniref:RagB/SusD family nutrient uptake outer membrane protein n=1 Tax=Lacihabitans sp. LS3-19 TaxID=2487335 RepID=UPI0020CF5316|nr:RagB/SusD family nutrient uptake outer membrane protein [Lacihabitans sp. LS3-19]MCP9766490.1 RagB/SusD family nutrient uptake outer membrane protein [Lacihabitans sp. LS3-19]